MSLSRLTLRHKRVAQLLALGQSYQAIAAEVGASASSVGNWAYDPLVVEEVTRLQGELVREAGVELRASTKTAVALLVHACNKGLTNAKCLPAAVKAAIAILDRSGLAPPKDEPEGATPPVPDSLEELLDLVDVGTLRRLVEAKEKATERKG